MNFDQLKNIHREVRTDFPNETSIRIHRSLSWINRAEIEKNDLDSSFIFYWIAFNSAYSENNFFNLKDSEKSKYLSFFKKILSVDKDQLIYKAIWSDYSGPIRNLINNVFVYDPFWRFHNGENKYCNWESDFNNQKQKILLALKTKNTLKILNIVFSRLYVLRNQILHGGTTWNSKINRNQIRDSQRIIKFLVVSFVFIMLHNKQIDWGKLSYPIINTD